MLEYMSDQLIRQLQKLTVLLISRAGVPTTEFAPTLEPGSLAVSALSRSISEICQSSDARWTRPSRKAYSASRNALDIFDANSGPIAFGLVGLVELDAAESAPPATLYAAAELCL